MRSRRLGCLLLEGREQLRKPRGREATVWVSRDEKWDDAVSLRRSSNHLTAAILVGHWAGLTPLPPETRRSLAVLGWNWMGSSYALDVVGHSIARTASLLSAALRCVPQGIWSQVCKLDLDGVPVKRRGVGFAHLSFRHPASSAVLVGCLSSSHRLSLGAAGPPVEGHWLSLGEFLAILSGCY